MRTLKILNKRHLALFMALIMFTSMPQINSVAAESENGTSVNTGASENVDTHSGASVSPDINLVVVDSGNDGSTDESTPSDSSETTPSDSSEGVSSDSGESSAEPKEDFDLTETERPEQSDTVQVGTGPAPTKEPGKTEEAGEVQNPDETKNPGENEGSADMKEPDTDGKGTEAVDPDNTGDTAEIPDPDKTGNETEIPDANQTGNGTETEEPGKTEDSGDMDKVQGEDVSQGTEERNWEIFYDKEKDVYRLTFNIGEDAQGDQVIDLTYALKLLSEYAEEARKLIDDPDYKFKDEQSELDALRQQEANVLQPGDVRKFEIFLTSDSKHTYKYKEGSFTLATADLGNGMADGTEEGEVAGFDGQKLPDQYVDNQPYYVTLRSEPIQDLLIKEVGIDPWDARNGLPRYAQTEVYRYLETKYGKGSLSENLNQYLLDYYSTDDVKYSNLDELMRSNDEARKQLTLTDTSGNKYLSILGEQVKVDVDLKDFQYNNFYQNLLSFIYGSQEDIDQAVGEGTKIEAGMDWDQWKFRPERWEYENESWTSKQQYEAALYYYMAHEEIWKETDSYFQQLLDGGLTKEQATWTSFMMAINLDGEMTGNKWQDTVWPWYNSIQLEQMDIDFSLKKVDGESKEVITESETGFQIYYIDTVKDGDTTKEVKMYCTYDEATNSYTFVATPSTVWTKNGELNISYALMKDIVYYLQETVAPEGYELDTKVYVIMDQDSYNAQSESFKESYTLLGKGIEGEKFEVEFVNVKTPDDPDDPDTPDDPDDPDDPDTPDDPDDPDTPDDPDDPDDPTPQTDEPEEPVEEIPEEEVPLAEPPEETTITVTLPVELEEIEPLTEILDEVVPMAAFPDEELVDLFDDEVPLADVPATGDISVLWYLMIFVSGSCLLGFAVIDLKKRKEAMAN